jgi:pyruvate formate lyase activating enzyme
MEQEAMLYEPLSEGRVHCYLCAHHCRIAEGSFGICGVRQNREGVLYTLVYGELISARSDPIEKKPFCHFLPGTRSFSIATMGCNFKCGFCQNWQISQVNKRDGGELPFRELTPEQVVQRAVAEGCASIAYTYTEPTIFFELAHDTAAIAHERGLKNVFVTNGYMTAEALDSIQLFLDAANVDLKSFRDEFYRRTCKARLTPVLETISGLKKRGIWVEVTTLVVPGENDSEEELRDIAEFISGVSPEIPWHISRFYPQYEYGGAEPTPVRTLRTAERIGTEAGLRHIHLGNV